MATLEDVLSRATPLERVGWLVYSANWYERQADRHARQPASSKISADEAHEFGGVSDVLRQQADIELHREINRGAANSADEQRWLPRLRVRRRAARADRELDETAAEMTKDGRSAAVARAMAHEAPDRPGGGTPDTSIVEKARHLVRLRSTAYTTGASTEAIAANEAHASLNLHLNRLAVREIVHNERNRNQGTRAPLPDATASGLGRTRRELATDPRSGSAGTSTATADRIDGKQRTHGIDPQQGRL